MTLVGVKIDNSVTRQSGPYYFKIQEELHYLSSALFSYGDYFSIYTQIYILDTAEQLNIRRLNNRNLDPVVMDNLQIMLLDSYSVTNFIWSYLHQFFDYSHSLNGTQKPLKKPFD